MNPALLTLGLFFAPAALGDTYTVVQTGGYAGFVAVGVGGETEHFGASAMFGYVPELIAGEELYSITIKPEARVAWFKAGVSLLASLDEDTFWWQPAKYPDDYYPPTGLRLAPYAGFEIKADSGNAIYAEITCLDHYLELKARNWDYVKWADIVNASVGVKWYH